jgi:hypothetical protein
MKRSIFPTPFIEKTILSPMYVLNNFVKSQLVADAWVYYLAVYSIPLVVCYLCQYHTVLKLHPCTIFWSQVLYASCFVHFAGFLRLSMYKIMSSTSSDNLTSFLIWMSFISFCYLISLARTSRNRLMKVGIHGLGHILERKLPIFPILYDISY